MKIACLGWGSLIWDPLDLPVQKPWFSDGPLLPIEFARQSQGDRITLVIVPNYPYVRTLWALMSIDNLDDARSQLGKRENIPNRYISQSTGYWSKTGKSQNNISKDIGKWSEKMNLDAVVWTALKPKFRGKIDEVPSSDEVISFLQKLPPEKKKVAELYVRLAPLQVNTSYRRKIELDLNWTPITYAL